MDTPIQEFPFPDRPAEQDYRLFPASLEYSLDVFFHGTSEEAAHSIIVNGFRPGGTLASSAFVRGSAVALGYACDKRPLGARGAVLAVRFRNLSEPGIRAEGEFVYLYKHEIQPEIVGICYVPDAYRHT